MTALQKFIKFAAIAFGVFLIVSITFGIFGLFAGTRDLSDEEIYEIALDKPVANRLEIELEGVELTIKTGAALKVETNNENVSASVKDDALKIKECSHWYDKTSNGKVILTVPDALIPRISLEIGAGKVVIEKLTANFIEFDFGAGEVLINELYAYQSAEIECGAGKFTLSSGQMNNLDMDLGVGEVNFSADAFGNSRIKCGVGELNLTLGKKSNYQLELHKGIGRVDVSGVSYEDNATVGGGANKIRLDGGVGAINVQFAEE